MRFDRIVLRGLGPFRSEVELDLTKVSGQIVAIAGANGAGKSTLLELLAGALYRETPTRGALAGLATARDAYVETRVVNGKQWTIRQTVDGVSGKGEALVLDDAGAPVLPDTKVRSFDAWAKLHLPSPEVLYCSTFAPQGSGGFLELSAGERKAVLLRVLGIERLEQLAERARERARDARQRLTTTQARLADERERSGDVGDAERAFEAQREGAERADCDLLLAREALTQLEHVLEQHRELARAADDQRRRRADLVSTIDDRRAQLMDLERRIANNARVLGQAGEIRAAVARAQELDQRHRELEQQHQVVQADEMRARMQCTDHVEQIVRIELRQREAQQRRDRAQQRLRDRDLVVAALEALPAQRRRVELEEAGVRSAEELVEKLRELLGSSQVQRIGRLRDGLDSIVSGVKNPRKLAGTLLTEDDELAARAQQAPEHLTAAKEALAGARRALETARNDLQQMERAADRRSEMQHVEEDERRATADLEQATHELEAAKIGARDTKASADALLTRARQLRGDADAVLVELTQLRQTAKLAEPLAQAEARLAELEPQRTALQQEIERLGRELEALPAPAPLPPAPDAGPARRHAEEAERSARSTQAAVAVAEARLATARKAAERLAVLGVEQTAAEEELADWERLAQDLGRDGLQALEIDAAGPELTELVNDLLRTCVGSRWTVTIEATRQSSDGKRQLEGCEVRVLDTERGREGTAESLSGGERVLVGEALSLALSMLACRRAGVQGPTLVRDESGAALDPTNARAYVAMLRRAADIVGASHVLFVSHNQDVQELADARIEVRDGRLEVMA